MKKIRATIFSCTLLLALGAFAQETTKPSDQPQQPPDQREQTAPPQQQQQAPSQPQQQAPAQPQPPTIDDQVKALSQELSLDAGQQAKVKTILEDQRTQAMAVIGDGSTPRAEKVQKISAIREQTIAKVRALLNDDQKKKLDQMLQEPNEPPPAKEPQANPTPK
ncbi:MAG TPA: hypothetical protein VKE93_14600 [Candidatus Angelobacter sp.]|nr:hypothetical protein [Candidatus Angelobacter sp.]